MHYPGRSALSALVLTAIFSGSVVSAEKSAPTELTSEQKTAIKEQLGKYAVIGQRQIVHLTKQALEEYGDTLTNPAPHEPAAWMLLEDGKTIKRVNMGEQSQQAPDKIRILMYRAALKSVARRGKIHATAILYTGKLSEGSDNEALVFEYEHRLGISGNKVVPFQVANGKVTYSDPINSEKPFQIFYDSKEDFEAEAN